MKFFIIAAFLLITTVVNLFAVSSTIMVINDRTEETWPIKMIDYFITLIPIPMFVLALCMGYVPLSLAYLSIHFTIDGAPFKGHWVHDKHQYYVFARDSRLWGTGWVFSFALPMGKGERLYNNCQCYLEEPRLTSSTPPALDTAIEMPLR